MMLINNFRRFVASGSDQRWLLTEAVMFLFTAKFLLMILPVKTVMKITLSSRKAEKQPDPDLLKQIKRALYRAGRLSFWKNRCLVQSIAGRWMLQRRGTLAQISFGVKHDINKKVIAHAWLKAGDVVIVDEGRGYNKLASF